jgi:hypothetical protein
MAPQQQLQPAPPPPPDSGIDHAQLQEILAFSDAAVDAMPPGDEKAVILKVRRAVAWPLPQIMTLPPGERDEILALRAELQTVLGRR